MEGLLDDAGDVVGILDQITVLGEGGNRTGDIYLLENITAQQMAGNLTGDGHHRDGIHIGGGNAGDQIGSARAGSYHAHTNFAADAGIAGGHVAGILLGTHQSIADLRVLLQGIHCGADGRACITENMIYLLLQQAFYQCLCSVHTGNLLLLGS